MKETFFFSHDYNARNDPKMQRLLMKHGCAGIGVFWCIIEQLYEQGGELPMDEYESIAFALRVDASAVQSIINESGLFKNDGVIFWSESVKNRLNKRSEIAEKRKKAAMNRWGKSQNDDKKQQLDNNSMQVHKQDMQLHQNPMQDYASKVKESKVKENKENTSLNKEEKKVETAKRFAPPSIKEVQSYISEKSYSVDAESFVSFYTSKNWFVGKNKMKDWHAAVVTWEKRKRELPAKKQSTTKNVNDIWKN